MKMAIEINNLGCEAEKKSLKKYCRPKFAKIDHGQAQSRVWKCARLFLEVIKVIPELVDFIMAVDETWVHHTMPETK